MTDLTPNKLTILVLVLVFGKTWCICRYSYMTFCDSLDDFNTYDIENWTEVVVGSELSNPSQLRSINANDIPLDQFEKLTTMIIIGQVNDIKTGTFAIDPDDSRLEYLQLYANDIKRLKYSSFDAITLRKLSLINNNIEYIHKQAFYNCDIQTFDLSNNKLEIIEKEVFTDDLLLNSTKEIVIKFNQLEVIEPKSFPSSLEILNLDYNNLAHLRYDVFENLCNLQELTLSHNKLTEVPNVKSLKEIRFLNFSFNKIIAVRIGEFNNLKNLEVLDLGNNRISNSIMFRSFQFPQRHPSLQISLVFNRLTHLIIGNDSFRDHIVFLYGNPWNCKCWESLERFMVDNDVKRNKCDLMFFGNGQTPYCINYPGNDCTSDKTFIKNPNFTEKDKDQFIDLIKNKKNNISCSLSPRRL
ncbi:LRR 8 domain containing protein [Asbolus verrucosus]|uniref:LRR 8 domain containing protein n=1 Tax=Asbolus verrucosus TaxID=1661398 RepID=A0A482WAU1_ASBVE|nr:LRR 8 domain containing protein [Asbolus verrucosus]